MDTHESLDAIESEVDKVQPEADGPVNFLRVDPKNGFSLIGVDTVILYFDNRPTDVKMMGTLSAVQQTIVKDNTVEISVKQPIVGPRTHFTVTWNSGLQSQSLVYVNSPVNVLPEVLRVEPPDGSSIVGVRRINVWFDEVPANVKYYDHALEGFSEVLDWAVTQAFSIKVSHPIEGPSVSYTISWTSRDGTAENSVTLTYTTEAAGPGE